jgi:hypothetical protein
MVSWITNGRREKTEENQLGLADDRSAKTLAVVQVC